MNKPVAVSTAVHEGQRVVLLTLDMATDQTLTLDGMPPARRLTVIQSLLLEDAGELASAIMRAMAECVGARVSDVERSTAETVGAAVLDGYESRVHPAVTDAEARRGSYWLGDG